MHKSMNKFGLAGIATVFALTPAMIIAQDDTGTDVPTGPSQEAAPPSAEMTPEQDATMQSWPADKQSAFKLWPAETQAYFWSLSAERQNLFWALSDSDKVTLSTMAEPQRESTWAQIESRAPAPRS